MRIVCLVLLSALLLISASCKTQTHTQVPVVGHKGLIVATFLNPTMDEDAARAADSLAKVLKEHGILNAGQIKWSESSELGAVVLLSK